ncbi:MAG: excinuclease ABC subunit UvrA [Bacteroidota bacterium]|nr:excinuclease ABC subunit UvrA [Bacteroidota bacterium]
MTSIHNNSIYIKQATENNLKNIDIEIPHNKIVVISGVSGSGKSSIAHDIIANESHRRYFETFSTYARQKFGKIQPPDAAHISGLSPVITVSQRASVKSPRSTVGTLTELYDILRLLFARLAKSDIDSDVKQNRSLFSFNSSQGACSTCNGLGVEDKIDVDKIIADKNKTLREGALAIMTPTGYIIYSQVTMEVLNRVCEAHNFNVDIPWKELSDEEKYIVMYGSDKIKIPYGKHTLESRMKWTGIKANPREEGHYKGIIPVMENILKRDRNKNILRFTSTMKCSECGGDRLNNTALSYKFHGKNIMEFSAMTIEEIDIFFSAIRFTENEKTVGNEIKENILKTTETLIKLGLGFLPLNRSAETLNGGIIQRIKLAKQARNELRGIIYVLDEPSIGLHLNDNHRLMELIKRLKNNGNSVLIVEHDEEIIRSADKLLDIGPGAGINGGEIVAFDSVENLLNNQDKYPKSKTIEYLNKPTSINENEMEFEKISISGINYENLNSIDVEFFKRGINIVSGVTGSGKSALVHNVIGEYFSAKAKNENRQYFDEIIGDNNIKRAIEIDQSPIGKTPRSNPATYTKLWDNIRTLFASLEESRGKKFDKGRFSFNVKGGRCETCQGAGKIQIGMHFMGDVDIVCSECGGKRFNNATLAVKYRGKSVYDILEMQISEAMEFFKEKKKIFSILKVMNELGLGYINLGQSSTTLSGGEAQRIKLAAELSRTTKGDTLYLLNEPTTGLHFYDIEQLYKSLRRLTKAGHTIICIENQPDFILNADNIIDLGPGSGDKGGRVIAQGRAKKILNNKNSVTGLALNKFLKNSSHTSAEATLKTARTNTSAKAKTETTLKQTLNAPITFKGVNIHNIKELDFEIPYNKLTVVTGVSGSGKTSLAFDTLFAEGQRKYLESFSTYARSMMEQKEKPDYEKAKGLTPTIAINQKAAAHNPRSTVGTMTEIYDFYRLLFSRIANANNGGANLISSHFSFNHEHGACEACNGLGEIKTTDPKKIITNPELPITSGAMDGTKTGKYYGDPYGQYIATIKTIAEKKGFDIEIPWQDISKQAEQIIMFGCGNEQFDVNWEFKRKNREGSHQFTTKWRGIVAIIDEEYQLKHADKRGTAMLPIMKNVACSRCNGKRLKKEFLQYKFAGKDISELSKLTIAQSITLFEDINIDPKKYFLDTNDMKISYDLRIDILKRLHFLNNLGLSYIGINRLSSTLSGGEAQRVRLGAQLGTGLTGITYILDEPTIGLHSKDTKKLIKILQQLRNNGNTVVVVEHDKEIINAADIIIDMGPEAGVNGGNIVAVGTPEEIRQNKNSITGDYLCKGISKSINLKSLDNGSLKIENATANNLKIDKLKIPLSGLIAITGVSGSGKSSLMHEVIAKSHLTNRPNGCSNITGWEKFDSLITIDQRPIGTSPLSNAATYTGIFDEIRTLFASTKGAKKLKLKKNYFSFNSKGGRCEHCKGQGQTKISMDFLSDVWVKCEYCNGKRYRAEALEIEYHDKNISEVLKMNIDEALLFFNDEKNIFNTLQLLSDIGLGYLSLGQAANTLSGGEAQRLKLAKELTKTSKGKSIYLLDEPTTGLHFKDIEKLLSLLEKLANAGNSIIVIEHNEEIIKNASHVVNLGPGAGELGGQVC